MQVSFAEIIALLSVLVAVLSLVYTFSRGKRMDVSADAQLKSDVGYIKARIDEVVKDQKELADNVGDLSERVAKCEEGIRQAHKMIDEILCRSPYGLTGAKHKTVHPDEN